MRILRVLFHADAGSPPGPSLRSSYAVIAARLGVDEDTVRHRVHKLEDSGFLGAWRLQVNPRIWGGGQVLVLVDVDPQCRYDELADELRLLPGTLLVGVFYGRLGILLEYDHEATLRDEVELARRLCDAPRAWVGRVSFRACDGGLSARDWDLLRALRSDPTKPYTAVAGETGMSVHTVQRRLSRIVEEGYASAGPTLNPRAAGSGVLACLSLRCPNDRRPEVDGAIADHLRDHLWNVLHLLPLNPGDLPPSTYSLALPHILMARDIVKWARGLPQVREARIDLHEDVLTNFPAYDAYLDGKIRRMPSVLAGAQPAPVPPVSAPDPGPPRPGARGPPRSRPPRPKSGLVS